MDASNYLDIPFRLGGRTREGCDCYGLYRLVLIEAFGLHPPELPELRCGPQTDPVALAEAVAQYDRSANLWVEVSAGLEQSGDAVVLRSLDAPLHLGLVVAPGRMLHMDRGGAAVEDYGSRRWRNRVIGMRRYIGD